MNDAVAHESMYQLDGKDKELLNNWRKARVTAQNAKLEFSKALRNCKFDSIWQMKYERDRVLFCRYLFTGCIFVDEKDIVCGNPTMFTEFEGMSRMPIELFFEAIDLSSSGFRRVFSANSGLSLYDTIVLSTVQMASKFRVRVLGGAIDCHFQTKVIDSKDTDFAKYIKSLHPYGIDWSNIPDYLERKDFVKFARACSVEETVHTLHFMNWPQYVLGACHVDWAESQTKCLEMFHQHKKLADHAFSMINRILSNQPWCHFFEGGVYSSPLNELNSFLGLEFKKMFEDFYLSDEKGNPLNRFDWPTSVCDGKILTFFNHCPFTFCTAFSFDPEISFQSTVTL